MKLITGSAFANEDENVLDFFRKYGFNVAKDIKNEEFKPETLDSIADNNTDSIRDLQKSNSIRSHNICANDSISICAVKIIKNA